MNRRIYMDHHATTPVDPRVLQAMLPYFTEKFGNAASRTHAFGREAEEAVEGARQRIAELVGADPKEIIFTSGATESDNLALKGAAEAYRNKGNHIITVATEHKAVLDPCRRLEEAGLCRATVLPVRPDGLIDLDRLSDAVTDKTILISVMFANNEIGVIQPIAEIGKIAAEKGVIFHTDAAQAAGKEPIDVDAMGIGLMSLSAHKMYGPKGIGALVVRKRNPRVKLAPIIDGGGHERGLRSGTLNVPAIVGFGEACRIGREALPAERERLLRLRERLRKGIMETLEFVTLNGHPTRRLPGNLNLSFAYVEGESLLMSIGEIAVSSGSACTTATLEPSHVLRALGLREDLVHSSIRFGLGRANTEEEVEYTVKRVIEAVHRLRAMSPLYEMAKAGEDIHALFGGGKNK